MKQNVVLFILLALLIVPQGLAQRGHLTLLTVSESENGTRTGGTADLYLDIRAGTGQIFLDTFPLTRLDTQSSTRFANQVACAETSVDCTKFDFFYTIKANAPAIGGPSAGAAVAVLTLAMLEGKKLDEQTAITGTINSGGLIGPVGGEKEKAEAAKRAGITRVLISTFSYPKELNKSYVKKLKNLTEQKREEKTEEKKKGENNTRREHQTTNQTINLSKLYIPINLSEVSIKIIKVTTLREALARFTGEQYVEENDTLAEPRSYTKIMRSVAEELCTRRDELAEKIADKKKSEEVNGNKSRKAMEHGNWYSAASYCFSDLIDLRRVAFANLSLGEQRVLATKLIDESRRLQEQLNKKARSLKTLAELETYVIVSTRLEEVEETLQDWNESQNESAATLAFAYERFNSARVWSAFFTMRSPRIELDEEHLERACEERLSLAEERYNYADLYVPEYLRDARRELDNAWHDKKEGLYALCLFRASKAVAKADMIAGTISIPNDKVEGLIKAKIGAAKRVITREARKGFFPILGYSYLHYAESLAEGDPYSALTFSEYALELSNLDLYFPVRQRRGLPPVVWVWPIILFLSGTLFGGAVTLLVTRKGKKHAVSRRARKRRKR